MKFTWYSPAGVEIDFTTDDTATYKLLLGYDGISKIPCTHETQQAPYQDGLDWQGAHIDPREVSFDVLVSAPDLENLRVAIRNLTMALNPLAGPGWLVVTMEDGITEYSLKCIGNNTPSVNPRNRTGTKQYVTIDLIAFNPFFYSYPSESTYFGAGTPVVFPFAMPWTFPVSTPTQNITNAGDVPAEATIIVSGAITNPTITRSYTDNYGVTVSESLAFTLTMTAGEVLTITTGFGKNTITLLHDTGVYDTNPFQYLNANPKFWSLMPGDNLVSVTSSAISTGTSTGIEHASKYSGIA